MSTVPETRPHDPVVESSGDPGKIRIEIEVNLVKFEETHPERTGLEIKQDAIQAGARLQLTYVLDLETSEGPVRIRDDEVIRLRNGMVFKAHPGGQDS